MNKFRVDTPQEWKNNLYAKTVSKEQKATIRFKPVTVAAIVLIFVLTTTAGAFAAVPDFFKSIFQGNDEYLNPLYMPKNIELETECEELEAFITGIMGDKNNLAVSFVFKSKGEFKFDVNDVYAFETNSFTFENTKASNTDGYSTTFGLNYYDEKTLTGDLYITGNSGNGFTNKVLKIELKDLERLKPDGVSTFERVEDCSFASRVNIDYTDTSVRLSSLYSETKYEDIVLIPESSEISNITLNMEFRAIKGDVRALAESEYPFKKISVHYKDGTVSEFNFEQKTEKQNVLYVKSVAIAKGKYSISAIFGEAVDASKILSLEIDGVKMFAE